MTWGEIKEFANKQLMDTDDLDFIHAVAKGDELDVTIGYLGALIRQDCSQDYVGQLAN